MSALLVCWERQDQGDGGAVATVAGRRVRSRESTACCQAGEPGFDCGASWPSLACTACCQARDPGLGPVVVSICRLLLTHAYHAGDPNVASTGAAGISCAVELPGAGGDSGGEGEEQAARARAAAAQYTRRIRMTNTGWECH